MKSSSHSNNQLQDPLEPVKIVPLTSEMKPIEYIPDLKWKEAMQVLFKSSLPIAIVYFLNIFSRLTVFYFLRPMGQDLLSGAYGIGNTFFSGVCFAITVSLNLGMLSRLSQAYGHKKYQLMGYYLHRGFITNTMAQCVLAVFMHYSCDIFSALGYQTALAAEIGSYLSTSIPSIFLYMIFSTLNFYLISIRVFAPGAIIQFVGAIAYILMAGFFITDERQAVVGAAYANVISYGLLAILMILYIWYKNPLPESLFMPNKTSRDRLLDFFKHQLVVGSMLFVQWFGVETIGFFSGVLSPDQTAAYPATYEAIQLMYVIPIATGNTIMVFIGSAMSSKLHRKGRKYLKAGIIMAILGALITIAMYLPLASQIASLLLSESVAQADSVKLINLYMICIPADFLQMVMGFGLRAIGKEMIAFYSLVISLFLVGLPLALFLCFYTYLEMYGLVWGVIIGVYLLSLIYLCIYCLTNWKRQAERISNKIDREAILSGLIPDDERFCVVDDDE